MGELASTMSDVSGDSRLSSPPLSPHGGAHSGRANGGAVLDEVDTLQMRQGSASDPLPENGMVPCCLLVLYEGPVGCYCMA